MARPSLAEKMYQSLSKGPHVDAALRIASRLQSESEKTVEPAPVVANVFPISSPSQSSNRANNQSSSQASNRAIEQTIEQSSSHSDGCSDYQTVLQSDCQTVLQSDCQTVLQSDCQTVPIDVLTMSNNQSKVLKFLINAQGKTTARAISLATNLGIPSVRDILRRLKTKGFLCGIITVKDISFQGFLYTLNPGMIDYFISTRSYQTVSQSGYQTVLQSDCQTVLQSDCQTVLLSDGLIAHSSSLKTLKTTTTKDCQTVLQSDSETIRPSDSFVLTGPTGLFWEGEGLQESQAKKWCQQFEVEPQQMRQQLEWARFDLVGNGKSGEVRKDAISWFFGCLRQTGGCYPRPANYKSPTEIRAEQAEQAARDAREARERLRQAERDLEFSKLLSDPESAAYQQLLARASDFSKEMGGTTLEIGRASCRERV